MKSTYIWSLLSLREQNGPDGPVTLARFKTPFIEDEVQIANTNILKGLKAGDNVLVTIKEQIITHNQCGKSARRICHILCHATKINKKHVTKLRAIMTHNPDLDAKSAIAHIKTKVSAAKAA